jgi:PAS domain S-box-containing protein
MLVILVLAISILLQFLAAFSAFRLVRVTGKTCSWILISVALSLMGVRRLITLSDLIFNSGNHSPDLIAEIVAMSLSFLMFLGVLNIRPVFTEGKRAEEALRKSEDKFKYVFEHSITGKSITLPTGEISVNKALSELLGYSTEELKNKKWQEITHIDDIEVNQNALDPILEGKKDSVRFIKRYIHKNGSIVWADVGTSLRRDEAGKPLYFMTSVSDITCSKQAEEALREHVATFAKISSQVPGMLYRFAMKPDGTFSVPYSSDGIMEIFGCSPEDVRDNFEQIFKAIFPEDREKILQTINESAKSLLSWMYEYRVQLPGEPVKWILGNSIPEKIPDGTIVWSGYNTDITKHKLAEVALRESERLLSSIYNTTGDVIYCLAVEDNESYRFISVNKAFYNITGLSEGMVIGKLVNEIIPEPSLSMVLEKYRQAIKENSTIQWEETSDYPNGKVTGEVNISPVIDSKGRCTHLVGSVHDITEQKRVEEAIKGKATELERFNNLMVGRELKMIDLKKEINGLLKRLGEEEKYRITGKEELEKR